MRLFVIVSLFSICACAGFWLQGCAAPDGEKMKAKVDTDAYRMIDHKWKDDFGVKTNYRIDKGQKSPNDISIERTVAAGTILTLPQAVAIAIDHNRVYQSEKEDLYIKALDLRLARHQFEPILFGSGAAEYIKTRRGEAIEDKASVGVQKLLETGAIVGVNVTLSWIDVLSGDARGGLSRMLTVAGTQPLLRGSDPNIVLENLTQAERDLLYQVRSFNRYRKEFVVSIIDQYYEVLKAYDRLENASRNYDVLLNVCSSAEELAGAGRLPQYEFDQAVQDKLVARDTLIQAQKTYKQLLDDFKLSLALQTTTEFGVDYNELEAMREVSMTMPGFSETEAIETAMASRLDLANAYDAVNDAERKVRVALDGTRPDLRLAAAAGLKSKNTSDPTTLGRSRDTAAIGLQFDPQLDKTALENDYRLSLIILEQNRRFYEEKSDTITRDIREVYRDLTEAAQRYQVQTEQLSLAKRRFDNTMALLQYAKANTRDVLDAQKDLYRAQDAATNAMIKYTVSMLRFYLDVEVLAVRADGMWQTTLAAGD
jgi:outer membrane protein TolC